MPKSLRSFQLELPPQVRKAPPEKRLVEPPVTVSSPFSEEAARHPVLQLRREVAGERSRPSHEQKPRLLLHRPEAPLVQSFQ